jgi:hypothetical protein
MCLDLIGELNNFKNKYKIIHFIQKYQDEKTGYFLDKTAIPDDNAEHNERYILLQLTDLAQMALYAMKDKPKYKYLFLEKYKDKKYLETWFYGLKWKNPWLVSNFIMFILNLLIYENEVNNKQHIQCVVNLLNKTQNSKNGFWNLENNATLHNQMAGAYHFIFFYTYLGIKPSHIEKIIDSTLVIQEYDGLFNYATGGDGCDDLDAIDLLCRATFYTSYRHDDIKNALLKSYKGLIDNQNTDGGFCWAKRDTNFIKLFCHIFNSKFMLKGEFFDMAESAISKIKRMRSVIKEENSYWAYSGLDTMSIKNEDSDLFSTWFRVTSLAFIEKTFPEICNQKELFEYNLRKNSGLGFYAK